MEKNKRKMKVFIMEEDNKNVFLTYINETKKRYSDVQMEIKEALVDKRRKIPQTKIILHYFAGKCTS
jgi:hypothetical protein